MARTPHLDRLIGDARRAESGAVRLAALCAAATAASGAALLGLAGWFIVAAALAGAGGAIASFNYLLPSAAIRSLAIVRTLGRYFEQLGGHQAALGALARIRPAVFRAVASAPPEKALALSVGEANARLTKDVDALEMLIARAPSRLGALSAIVSGVALTALAGWGASVSTALFGLLAVGFGVGLARRLESAPGAEAQRAAGRLKDRFSSMAFASAELRCLGLEDWAVSVVGAEGEAFERAGCDLEVARAWRAASPTMLAGLAAAVAMVTAWQAGAPLALLAALVAAATVEATGNFARQLLADGGAQEAKQRLEVWLAFAGASLQADHSTSLASSIVLALPSGRVVLKPGMRLALVGRSGVGKTRWLLSLLGLQRAARGAVSVDSRCVAEIPPDALRAGFAYAPQEPTLLAGTVRENLHLAAPEASDPDLWSALRDANLDERVRANRAGLDEWIGESGERLSGGERRRLALARALLKPAPWLILDEPTEGLDAAAEAVVVARLAERLRRTGQGLILVSHRTAPLKLCDRLIEVAAPPPLERGRA